MTNGILQKLLIWGKALSDVLFGTANEIKETTSGVDKLEAKPIQIKLLLARQEVVVKIPEEKEALCRSVAKRLDVEFERLQTCYPEESSERLLAVLALTCALKPEKFNDEIEMVYK